jgi:diguanylate cyclase (GGDEF)-like protein
MTAAGSFGGSGGRTSYRPSRQDFGPTSAGTNGSARPAGAHPTIDGVMDPPPTRPSAAQALPGNAPSSNRRRPRAKQNSHQDDHELRSLLAMSTELARNVDPSTVGDLIARHIAVATGVDECGISYWDRESNRVITYGYFPAERREAIDPSYDLAEYPETARVLNECRQVVVDVEDETADPHEVAYLRSIGNRVSAMLPLVAKREAIGLVELTSAEHVMFDERRLGLAQTMANEAAMALENARLYERVRHQAFHDPLTRLANRSLFRDRLDHALAKSIRGLRSVSVLFVDLDDFKTINDTYGHTVGDALLVAAGERLVSVVRPGDTVARLGGDEFAVLLEDVEDGRDATAPAERILAAFSVPFQIAGFELFIGGSIGIAMGAAGERTADELLRNADFAMYQAKSLGKGRYAMFEPRMRDAAVERVELAALLRRALDRDELILHYQPIIDLRSGEVRGLEALVRWQQAERGLLMPGSFIDIAEETGLIVPIGRWVLREACRQVKAWQDRFPSDPPLSISVNLSARQFSDPRLVSDVAAAIRDSGIPATSLILEITESLLVREADGTISKLRAIRAMGVRLAIDDFGTGYSSLSYLQRFPLDVLKIDRAFIDAVGNAEGSALVRSIVDIGRSLRLSTVAEGIERPEQPAQLLALQCDMGQGFLMNRPQEAGAIDAFLARWEASSQPSSQRG